MKAINCSIQRVISYAASVIYKMLLIIQAQNE